MINVLLVDDSSLVRSMIKMLMKEDGRFNVCGEAENGIRAIELNEKLNPDMIIMDINMPLMDGIEATKKILSVSEPAVIAFTTEDAADVGFKCLEAGALEVVKKPDLSVMSQELLKTFLDRFYLIAEKRSSRCKLQPYTPPEPSAVSCDETSAKYKNKAYDAVVIGASTGGPAAILKVITGLGKNFPLPVFITQHIDTLFDNHLCKWLKKNTELNIKLAEDGESPLPGNIYIAPANRHMTICESMTGHSTIILTDDEPVHFLKPAVDKLFFSAAKTYGDRLITVVLTGMGRDGAEGCRECRNKGALTIAQNEATCTVFGMPRAAIEANAINEILPLEEIPQFIRKRVL